VAPRLLLSHEIYFSDRVAGKMPRRFVAGASDRPSKAPEGKTLLAEFPRTDAVGNSVRHPGKTGVISSRRYTAGLSETIHSLKDLMGRANRPGNP
jgi:hypothetical protein